MELVLLGIPIGIILLYFASEWLVRGAKGLATKLHVTPFIIGLTVVSMGTSAPEAITSVVSTSNPELILGNVVGSNIVNIGVAISVSALISPIVSKYSGMRIEMISMILLSLFVVILCAFDSIGLVQGIVLLALMLLFYFVVYKLKKNDASGQEAYTAEIGEEKLGTLPLIGLVALGLVLLYVGARVFVDGAVELAHIMGLSDLLIGLVIVAIGTSLPEICVSALAARRGENELAVSNIIGSNIFNIVFVLGIGAVLTDIPVSPNLMVIHLPVMVLLALMMFLVVRYKDGIGRMGGAALLAVYVAYIAIMVMNPDLTI